MGYAIVGLFLLTWIAALAIWRWRGIEGRWQLTSTSLAAGAPET
jgi:high-affinity nickel-transport protein